MLLDEPDAGVDEERDAPEDRAHLLLADPRPDLVEHRLGGRHREGDLLHRRRARLLQVVGAHVDRVPLRDLVDRVGDHVADQPHRRRGREGVGPAREVLLDDVVLGRARQHRRRDPVLLRHDDVERQQPRRRRVDRHRRVHAIERDAVHQRVHVALVRDRHADLADLAPRELVIGVVARLRRQVERDGEPRLALRQVAPVELIGPLRGRVAGVGPHHPGTIRAFETVLHVGIFAARATHRRHAPGQGARDLLLGGRRLARRSGPPVLRGHAARRDRGRAPEGPAPDAYPLRPRRRGGRARAPLARPARLRPRARRAAPRGPRQARRLRRPPLRRHRGAQPALGRGRAGPGGEPPHPRGRREGARGRLHGRVHARPRLPPRLLPARADRHRLRRRHGRRPRARRSRSRSRPRRRPTSTSSSGRRRSRRSPAGSRRRWRSPTSARSTTRPSSSTACARACTPRPTSPSSTTRTASSRPTRRASASRRARPPTRSSRPRRRTSCFSVSSGI